MGVTLECKGKNKGLDLTYSGMARLRTKVAKLADSVWGEEYEKLLEACRYPMEERKKIYDSVDTLTDEKLSENAISEGIADFCMQPDCSGSVASSVCGEILNLLEKNKEDGSEHYGYGARTDNPTIADIKELLRLCCNNHCELIWY